jgi:hypothetical protein
MFDPVEAWYVSALLSGFYRDNNLEIKQITIGIQTRKVFLTSCQSGIRISF